MTEFFGDVFDPALDGERLSKQQDRIYEFMSDGGWHTLREIHHATGAPEASASAQLRAFRHPRFGAHFVDRRRRGDGKRGLFEYRVVPGSANA